MAGGGTSGGSLKLPDSQQTRVRTHPDLGLWSLIESEANATEAEGPYLASRAMPAL